MASNFDCGISSLGSSFRAILTDIISNLFSNTNNISPCIWSSWFSNSSTKNSYKRLKLLSSYVGERTITYEGYGQTSVNASKDDLESDIEYKAFDLGISAGIKNDILLEYLKATILFNEFLFAINKSRDEIRAIIIIEVV